MPTQREKDCIDLSALVQNSQCEDLELRSPNEGVSGHVQNRANTAPQFSKVLGLAQPSLLVRKRFRILWWFHVLKARHPVPVGSA